MTPPATLATRLKALREQAGLTQQQLADRSGLHRVHLAQLETGARGIRAPSFATVTRLARALGCKPEDLGG